MKIAICDDEKTQIEYLNTMIHKWSAAAGQGVITQSFQSAESFLFAYEEEKDFDLLLLDIQMDGEDGLSLARKLRSREDKLIIVFVTGLDEFIGEGYEVSALHYLIKPVKEEKLFSCLDKAVEKMKYAEPVLLVQVDGEVRKLLHKDIIKIEAFAHTCVITTIKDEMEVNKSLGILEKELNSKGFFRCHRSILVNLSRIEVISKTEVQLEGGFKALVSRRLYTDLNQAFIKFNTANC